MKDWELVWNENDEELTADDIVEILNLNDYEYDEPIPDLSMELKKDIEEELGIDLNEETFFYLDDETIDKINEIIWRRK